MEAKRPHRLLRDRLPSHGTILSARRRAKRSVNEDSVSRTPRKPSRRLRPMSVNVSTVRPRSASVCHHEARVSTLEVAEAVTRARSRARSRPRRPSAARAARARRRTATASTPSAAASRGHIRRQRKTSPLTMLRAWFGGGGRGRRPDEVVGEQARVGHVGDRLPLLARAREVEATTGLAADRRVDGERHAHVHRVAEGPADQRVRPVHRPREPVALGRGEQDVLLDVVEVLVRQARLVLGEGRVRLNLRVRLERPEVVLESGDERDVAHRLLGGGRVEQVLEHAPVDVAVLGLGRRDATRS